MKLISTVKNWIWIIILIMPMIILTIYRWRTDNTFFTKIKDALNSGDLEAFNSDGYFFNIEKKGWSDKVLHTTCFFWLAILFLYIIL